MMVFKGTKGSCLEEEMMLSESCFVCNGIQHFKESKCRTASVRFCFFVIIVLFGW